LATQPEPGHERDVVAPHDTLFAMRARRGRTQQRALLGILVPETGDANIQKTAHAQSEHGGDDDDERVNAHAAPRTAESPPRPPRSATRRHAPTESPRARTRRHGGAAALLSLRFPRSRRSALCA